MSVWTERLNRFAGSTGAGVQLLDWAHECPFVSNEPHRHGFYEACLVGMGTGWFSHGSTVSDLRPGSLFVPRVGTIHRIEVQSHMELMWLSFALSPGVGGVLGEFDRAGEAQVMDDGSVESLWRVARSVRSPEGVRSLGVALTTRIAESLTKPLAEESPSRDAAFERARRFLADNLAEPLLISHVAREAGVSERTLDRLFCAHLGHPPGAELARLRMAEAARLLRGTDLTVRMIGRRVGYPEPSHFVRRFARTHGETPGDWRKKAML